MRLRLEAAYRAKQARNLALRLIGRGPARTVDCGEVEPRVRYRDRSFAREEVTPDQARIEEVLPRFLTPDAVILHVGVGSSRIARRFAGEVREIHGITVNPDEKEVADALGLANYRVRVLDKYASEFAQLGVRADVIVDNNPSSFVCCERHFDRMIAAWATLLAPGGVVLTDRRGLRFCEAYAFGLSPRGLRRWVAPHGLRVARVTGSVLAVSRVAPDGGRLDSVRGAR